MIRVALPFHLQTLAGCGPEVELDVVGKATQQSVLEALEARFPVLRGTVRDHGTLQRRPLVRFYADGRDISFDPVDRELPDAVVCGDQPFMIVGAMSGG
jgi:molybdopterin synthase sulfur carrier subunit